MFSQRPDLAYHTIQCVFFGVMAVTTLRMKYLWTPYMCILASVGLGDCELRDWLINRAAKLGKLTVCTYIYMDLF